MNVWIDVVGGPNLRSWRTRRRRHTQSRDPGERLHLLVLEVMFVRRPLAVTILRSVTYLRDATRYLTSMGTLVVFGMTGVT